MPLYASLSFLSSTNGIAGANKFPGSGFNASLSSSNKTSRSRGVGEFAARSRAAAGTRGEEGGVVEDGAGDGGDGGHAGVGKEFLARVAAGGGVDDCVEVREGGVVRAEREAATEG